jgi:hypothetical protein
LLTIAVKAFLGGGTNFRLSRNFAPDHHPFLCQGTTWVGYLPASLYRHGMAAAKTPAYFTV